MTGGSLSQDSVAARPAPAPEVVTADPSLSDIGSDRPLSPATRKIIHVDMDAFYASVEQRDHAIDNRADCFVASDGST